MVSKDKQIVARESFCSMSYEIKKEIGQDNSGGDKVECPQLHSLTANYNKLPVRVCIFHNSKYQRTGLRTI